jgi:hypothetical protein
MIQVPHEHFQYLDTVSRQWPSIPVLAGRCGQRPTYNAEIYSAVYTNLTIKLAMTRISGV